MSGDVAVAELAADRADLYAELEGLLAAEQHDFEMDTFIESMDQAKDALTDLASDTKAITGTIGEHQDTLTQAADALQQANGELADFLSKAADAGGKVKDGVEGLATSATAAAGKLEAVNAKLKKIRELIEAGDGDASDMLLKFDEYLGDLVGQLEPFLGRIPGLGAFIQIWSMAIRNIAASAQAIESEVASRNARAREAGVEFDLYIKAQGTKGQRTRRIAELRAAIEKIDDQIGVKQAVEDANDQRVRNAEHGMASSAINDCLEKAKMSREEFDRLERELARTRRDLIVADDVFQTCEGALGLDGAGGGRSRRASEVRLAHRRMDRAATDLERLAPRFEELREKIQPIYECANDKLTALGTDGIGNRLSSHARSRYGSFRLLGDPSNLRLERTPWTLLLKPRSIYAIELSIEQHKRRKAAAATPAPAAAPPKKKQRKVAMVGAGAAVLLGTGALIALNAGPACAASIDPDCPPEVAEVALDPPSPTPTASPSPSPSPSPISDADLEEALTGALATLGTFSTFDVAVIRGGFTADQLRDLIYSISSVEPGAADERADLVQWLRQEIEIAVAPFEGLFGNTEYPCGLDDGTVIVACVEGAPPLEPGTYALVTMELAADVAAPTTEGLQAVYGYVVDRDSDPGNNWAPQGDFDWDYFQGTDTWFQLQGDLAAGTWTLTASEVTADQQIVPAALPARAIIRDNSVTFVVPGSAVPVDAPYRLTAFVHDGSFRPEVSGGDVTGDDPTQPLAEGSAG